ncbi:class IV adenylate cyclase [Photobacterium ganghwense]|uniref:class IV adenylate cyclase n=1 Tax=Photobacterium ganghwense TaxID=320778 RepID=UPI0039EE14EF
MSSEHFQGKYEVELKYRLASKSAFLAQLKQMPHEVMLEENVESDTFFDTPSRTYAKQGKSVSIRSMSPSGIQLWIVKGPEPDRCEAVNITDADKACSMLLTMGLAPVLRTSKTRSIYFLGEFHITVDSLAGIGYFAEFAIMTDDEAKLDGYREQLTAMAAQFGLQDSDRECRSYRDMQA